MEAEVGEGGGHRAIAAMLTMPTDAEPTIPPKVRKFRERLGLIYPRPV
jgi:hypothetical protein